jgi:ribonuclease BN (tRNA processing enzyme)
MSDPSPGRMTVTVLGCAGTFPGPGDACSGYLVRSRQTAVVVDLGAGTLANLQRHAALADVDAVVLTHEHPDHWLDLPLLRNAMRYVLGLEDLPVYGTAGTREKAGALIGALEPTLRWRTLDPGAEVTVGDMVLRFSRTDHPVETLAVRIDGPGSSLLYSADTGPAWRGDGVAGGVDTFLCEASFGPRDEGRFQHLSARQAGALATEVGASQLVLTHVSPGIDRHEQRRLASVVYRGAVVVAETGATFTV